MSIMSQEAKKGLGCVLHWSGESAISGTYDDDGNKRGFLILPDGVTVTPTGTFAVGKMKDGRNIWKFDGSTNFVTMSNHSAWEFGSGDFTICYWENRTTDGASIAVLSRDSTTLYVPFLIGRSTGTLQSQLYMTSNGTSFDIANAMDMGTIVLNTWIHYAVVRSGSTITTYQNGVKITSVTSTASLYANSNALSIAKVQYPPVGSMFPGNLKDLMIFKGKALTQDQIAAIMAETYIY